MRVIIPKATSEQLSLFGEAPTAPMPKTLKEFEALFESGKDELESELAEGYKAYSYKSQSMTLKDPSSKYKVGSALQKAVRRGHTLNAEGFAQAIHNSEEQDYVWHRLGVIAYEDVGIANLKAVAITAHCCRYKRVRDQYNTEKLVSYLAKILSEGNKSRLLTEITCLLHDTKTAINPETKLSDLTDLERICGGIRNTFNWYAPQPPINKIKELTEDLYSKKEAYALALRYLENIPPSLHPYYKYAFLAGNKISAERLNTAMPYVASLMKPSDLLKPKIILRDTSKYSMVANLPDYAWDNHVREGGVAYRKFMSIMRNKVEWPLTLAALQNALFLTNASVVDKELEFSINSAPYKNTQEIKIASFKDYMEAKGVPPEEFQSFIDMLESPENQALLLKCKQNSAT